MKMTAAKRYILYSVGCILLWVMLTLAPNSPLFYENRSQAVLNFEKKFWKRPLPVVPFSTFKFKREPEMERLPGAGEVFSETAEIAAKTGIPLLMYGPGKHQLYERLEMFSERSGYDSADGLIWGLLGMYTDIRPTTETVYFRNFLLFLGVTLLLSWSVAINHRSPCFLPLCFVPISLLIYLPPIQSLLTLEYLNHGSMPIASLAMASYLLWVARWFQEGPPPKRSALLKLIGFLGLGIVLVLLSTVHSANSPIMMIMLLSGIPILMLRYRPKWPMVAGVVGVLVLANLLVSAGVGGLRSYRDQAAKLEDVPKPLTTNHPRTHMLYQGIGIFPNPLGIDISDRWTLNKALVVQKAEELGVPLVETDFRPGAVPATEIVYLKMWLAYLAKHPVDYMVSRLKANAWVVSKLVGRPAFVLLSATEQVIWCVVAVFSWVGIGVVIWFFVRYRWPLQAPVILLLAYIANLAPGLIDHPYRGFYSALPLAACFIVMGILGVSWLVARNSGTRNPNIMVYRKDKGNIP